MDRDPGVLSPGLTEQFGREARSPLPAQSACDITEALEGVDRKLDRLIHLYFLNRGILVTPFHNMLLISPETTAEDVDRHTAILAECAGDLTGNAA